MRIEPINAYAYTCTPMWRESCPIRSMVVTIYAKNREEADELFHRHAHQYFDQDLNLMVTTFGDGGFRQVNDEQTASANGVSPSGGQVYKDRQQSGKTSTTDSTGDNQMPRYENGQNETRIENNFKYHAPKNDQPQRYEEIREKAKELAHVINRNTPSSREQSLAFTALEEAVMHANSAIARNE